MTTEKKDLTGLENTAFDNKNSRKDAEYNLTAALLEAADFRNSDDNITEIEIKRGGKFLFSFRVHPLSEADSRKARKASVKMHKNPNGKNLPKIEGELNTAMFHSRLIYMATVEEDKQKIWHNQEVMHARDILDAVDMVDEILMVGEKLEAVNVIMDISGMGDDEDEAIEEYAKN